VWSPKSQTWASFQERPKSEEPRLAAPPHWSLALRLKNISNLNVEKRVNRKWAGRRPRQTDSPDPGERQPKDQPPGGTGPVEIRGKSRGETVDPRAVPKQPGRFGRIISQTF